MRAIAPQASSALDVLEVEIESSDPTRFEAILSAEQAALLPRTMTRARQMLEGRRIWNVNSTAKGGGVAEMLTTLLPYARGAGVDARWMVISGDDQFFTITKRIHNRLHGALGDGENLTDADRGHYESTLAQRLRVGRHRRPPYPGCGSVDRPVFAEEL